MLARMQNTLRMIGRQIHASRNARGLKNTQSERTELTWAKFIGSHLQVPEAYQEFFKPHRSGGQAFPYTVFTPAFQTLGYRITAKLVCAFEDEILFLEKNGNEFTAHSYPYENIEYVQSSSMLLDSRIKVSGRTRQGMAISSIVRFSSSTDYLFVPIVQKIRLHAVSPNERARNVEPEQFEQWIELNFKFMNLARQGILDGDTVLHAILQPEIQARLFKILGMPYYRTISPTHACILTDRELILIREEALQDRKDKYGAISEYISLHKIADLTLDTKNNSLLVLSIHLLNNERFERFFEASRQDEVDQLLIQFNARR